MKKKMERWNFGELKPGLLPHHSSNSSPRSALK